MKYTTEELFAILLKIRKKEERLKVQFNLELEGNDLNIIHKKKIIGYIDLFSFNLTWFATDKEIS